jgi:hypothetical protein
MRATICLLSLVAFSAFATDAGTIGADAGTVTGEALEWKAKPLFVLADSEAAIDKYVLAKPAERAKVKGILTKVTVGARVAGAIIVDNYELPYSRRVDVSADVLITDPEGKEILDKVSLAGAQTMDPKVMFALPLKPVFGLMFGLTDREGEYKVQVTVRDHIRGSSAKLETKFTVTR